jgi:hypothetical protein
LLIFQLRSIIFAASNTEISDKNTAFTKKAIRKFQIAMFPPSCKKIVENHGGDIYALSKPGDGATFSIILPYHINYH